METLFPILFFNISGGEIFLILLFVLLFFGPKKIPELAKMLGKGINEVKKVQREINKEVNKYSDDSGTSESIQKDIDDYKSKATSNINENDSSVDDEKLDDVDDEKLDDVDERNEKNESDDDSDIPYPYNQAGKSD